MKKGLVASPSVLMARCSRRRARTRRYACGRSAIRPRSHACCGAMKARFRASPSVLMARCWRRRAGDKTVRLWSLSNPTAKPRVLRGHEKEVCGVAFSPDGQVLATASGDQTVRLWSLSNPTAEPRVLRGHEAGLGCRLQSDGRAGDSKWDQAVRLRSHRGGVLRGQKRVVPSVRWQVLATASGPDGTPVVDGNRRPGPDSLSID